jgi:hypothetical protein
METCEVCSARVSELRRGRCWGCYASWSAARPVGLGAACCMCGDRRRAFLRSAELLGTFVPICHNCCGRALALDPMPQTMAEIRVILRRDRRVAPRRFGKADTRVFQRDRRDQDRRSGRPPRAVEGESSPPDLITDLDAVDMTRIHELPLPRPRTATSNRG